MCNSRTAESSIKGYSFQFDATIKALLETPHPNLPIEIEGIEDFDIHSEDGIEAVQCKYYEGTDLTRSRFREIIEPMLVDFSKRAVPIKYHVYGFFKTVDDLYLVNPTSFRSEVLCYYRLEEYTDKKKKRVFYNLATDLNLSENKIADFTALVKFTMTSCYAEHKQVVKNMLAANLCCTPAEVDAHHYPNAQSIIFEIACLPDSDKRNITKEFLLAKLRNTSNTIYSFLHLRTVGEAEFCQKTKRRHFTHTNISPDARFFILDCACSCDISSIKCVLHLIKDKWSSHRKIKMPEKERYAPFVFLRNLDESKCVTIQRELFSEGVNFVDGYPFRNSEFTIHSLMTPQTKDNQISLRFIPDMARLNEALNNTKHRNIIYDFYHSRPLEQFRNVEINSIPITCMEMVTQII